MLHAGDFCLRRHRRALSKLAPRSSGVFGNNADGDRLYLTERFVAIGTLHAGYHCSRSTDAAPF